MDNPTVNECHVLNNTLEKPYISLHLNNTPVYAFVDTGSDISLITHDFLLRFSHYKKRKFKLLKSPFPKLGGITGNTIDVMGMLKLSITLGNFKTPHTFLIIKGNSTNYPLLIGTDFLNNFSSFTFDQEDQKFTINKNISTECRFLTFDQTNLIKISRTLKPWDPEIVQSQLPFGFNCFPNETILASPKYITNLLCIPSISNVINKQIEFALVNISNQLSEEYGEIELEECSNHTVFNFKNRGRNIMTKILQQNHLMRPVLENHNKRVMDVVPMVSVTQIAKFTEKDNADLIEEGLDFTSGELTEDEIENLSKLNAGYSVGDIHLEPIEDIIELHKFPKRIQPYVEDIFVNNYPEVLARHAWDAGSLSQFLGKCTLQLKPNEKLPKNRRIYGLSLPEQEQLNEILEFMMKIDLIRKSPNFDKNPGYGCACYVIPRGNSSARLIVDFSTINAIIECPPQLVPDADLSLQKIKKYGMATTFDLKQGYYSFELHEDSRHITTFVTKEGAYEFNRLPTGCAVSPTLYNHYMHEIMNNVPLTDDEGNIVWENKENNRAVLVPAPISGAYFYFDDIVILTDVYSTVEETEYHHMMKVKEVVARLQLFGAKIAFQKSNIAQTKFKFLGWICSNQGIISADPKRIKKI